MDLSASRQPTLAESLSGPFDPGFTPGRLGRRAMATLGREWLLHGHLQDRAGMPLYLAEAGREEMERLAVDEWMLASPVYSRRMQRALRFEGSAVDTIFKNIQLDIGAPHQFMDFRFKLVDPDHGEFWLDHCGALMDVEPMGEDFVVGMCHHIEDPTFDATAAATNPFAQVRPLHRPPRIPADRHPHCHWTVTVVPEGEPALPHPLLDRMLDSPLAALPVEEPAPADADGGWDDYSGPFDPDFVLDELSRPAMAVALDEIAVQAHLLARAYRVGLAERVGAEESSRLTQRVLVAQAAMTATRLMAAADIDAGSGAESIAKLIQIHPLLYPYRLTGLVVDIAGPGRIRVRVDESWSALHPDPHSWLGSIPELAPELVESIAQAVDPTVRCVAPAGSPGPAIELAVGAAAPAKPPPELALIQLSTGAGFRFRDQPG